MAWEPSPLDPRESLLQQAKLTVLTVLDYYEMATSPVRQSADNNRFLQPQKDSTGSGTFEMVLEWAFFSSWNMERGKP
jgi:hypothetical protein